MNLLETTLYTIKCCRLVASDVFTKEDIFAISKVQETLGFLQPLASAASK